MGEITMLFMGKLTSFRLGKCIYIYLYIYKYMYKIYISIYADKHLYVYSKVILPEGIWVEQVLLLDRRGGKSHGLSDY